jgi:DNA-binding MarR family transcriptional regulator
MPEPESQVDFEILLQLHNMAAVEPEKAVEARDVAKILLMKIEDLTSKLASLITQGYVALSQDEAGLKKFYLTRLGIIKVASTFS